MKSHLGLASSAIALLALAELSLAANVVPMRISKPKPDVSQLQSRDFISQDLINNFTGGSYMIDISVGTPAQPISLVIDTGSSDVWVLSNTADQCTIPRLQRLLGGGCTGGTYNHAASSTYKQLIKNGFTIQYADGSGSSGDYFSDTFAIGTSSITALQMGLAINTTVGVGIMGIGYDTNEAAKTIYPSVMSQLVSQGKINSKAYSLYLDDMAASTGTILFGGIDTDKYHGSLTTLPVLKNTRGTYSALAVTMTALTIGTHTLTNATYKAAVILDSGTTLTYLPDALFNSVVAELKAVDDTSGRQASGNVYVDCALRSGTTTLKYTFGGTSGVTIEVPINEVIFDLEGIYAGGSSGVNLPFDNTCALGIMSAGTSGTSLLGDTFLRSAYVVYDLKNNLIALAQTNFDSAASNIIEISADATTIPDATGIASGVSATLSATGLPGKSVTATATGSGKVTSTTGTNTGTGTAAANTSKAAAPGSIKAFETGSAVILAISGVFALLGGSWFLA